MYARYFRAGEVFARAITAGENCTVRFFRIEDGVAVPVAGADCEELHMSGEDLLARGWEEISFPEVRRLAHRKLMF